MNIEPWVGMLLVFSSIILLARKKELGFWAGIAANMLFLVFNIRTRLWPYAVCNIVFIGTYAYGAVRWGVRERRRRFTPTVKEIVEDWLKDNGYDGLCAYGLNCCCAVDDELMRCYKVHPECTVEHKKACIQLTEGKQ